jgi:pimeloyl-ACP methyl ester carboxylesterase
MRSLGSAGCVLAISAVLLFSGAGSAGAAGDRVPHWKAWLCNPELGNPDSGRNWCDPSLSITVIGADGRGVVQVVAAPKNRQLDCFYVYPTVSIQRKGNADLRIQDAEKLVALTQATPFERVCRVFAPMYRQVTAYGREFHPDFDLAYADVLAAWRDYLAHHNHGRGVVLIGHSQGAGHLAQLLRDRIERTPSERKLLVSAILLGGGVTVANGSDTGGSFRSTPACRRRTQTGCVVAFSSWTGPTPTSGPFRGQPGTHVLCTNPAALAGGTARITPVFVWFASNGLAPPFPSRPATNFIAFPNLYTAHCVQEGSRAWLHIDRATSTGDPRPTVQGVLSPERGLHAADVNIALGDLLDLVWWQGRAWVAHH